MTASLLQTGRLHIRWSILQDVDDWLAIDRQSFYDPWSEADLIRCLREQNVVGMVVEHHNQVVGFMVYEMDGGRINLARMAVAVGYRRQGVGAAMIETLHQKLTKTRRLIVAEVLESNLAAQLFFRDMGFKAVKVLHKPYSDSAEDAYVMELTARQR